MSQAVLEHMLTQPLPTAEAAAPPVPPVAPAPPVPSLPPDPPIRAERRSARHLRERPSTRRAWRVYYRMRANLGILFVMGLFGAVWMLNGYFTAQAGTWIGLSWSVGAALHVVITAVELAPLYTSAALREVRAPHWIHLLIWGIMLPFGLIDTGSSAVGFLLWGQQLGLGVGVQHIVLATILAELIAFLPEPVVVWLILALRHPH